MDSTTGLWTGLYVFLLDQAFRCPCPAAGGALACEADWLCVYIHVLRGCLRHTALCARAVPPTALPVTDADRPVRVERSTSDGHIQRGSQGQPSRLCIPCIHKVPEAAGECWRIQYAEAFCTGLIAVPLHWPVIQRLSVTP